jgi:hypothetical protein
MKIAKNLINPLQNNLLFSYHYRLQGGTVKIPQSLSRTMMVSDGDGQGKIRNFQYHKIKLKRLSQGQSKLKFLLLL